MPGPGKQKPAAQYTTTKKAKATMDALASKVAKDFGIAPGKSKTPVKAKKAAAKGSVAKTFDVTKITGKLTKQDEQSLAMLKKKYGAKPYKSYDK